MGIRFSQIVTILTLTIGTSYAALYDVDISATRIKLEEQKTRDAGSATLQVRQIAYKVSVLNKSFKGLTNVEIKYMIFYQDVQPGSKDKPKELLKKGSKTIPLLETNRPQTFETTPVELSQYTLDANVYWTSGARGKSQDKVSGLWFRAYVDGKIVGEYVNPSSITQRQEWKD